MTTPLDLGTSSGASIISEPDRVVRRRSTIVLLRVVAVFATLAIALAAAVLLWFAPWPVDALIALAAAAAWVSWLDRQERK
jgi:fatty acid desaturase